MISVMPPITRIIERLEQAGHGLHLGVSTWSS